MESSK
jgi:hypothetical protein